MEKICHLTSAHPRHDGRILLKECSSLAVAGYDVTLVVNDGAEDEICGGVKILSTRYTAKNRVERMLKGASAVYRKALEVNADVYHLHDPELLPIGKKLKKVDKKVIFDAHEDTEKEILDKRWIPKPLLKIISFLYRYYSKSIMKTLDAIVTVTPQYVEKFRQYNGNTVLVTNYPIIRECEEDKNKAEPAEEKYVCFAGGISEQWMHDVIIAAIGKVEGIKYILAGNGSKDYFDRLHLLRGWNKVEYIGKIPHQEVKKLYTGAVAGMAINYCSQLENMGSLGNTKLFEYMEAQLPVICTDYPLWKEVVEGNHCGICVNPKDSDAVADAIVYLMKNPEEAAVMGANGRKAVLEKYNWSIEEKKLLQLYQQLLA